MKAGLDPHLLVEALSGGAAQSWVLANRAGHMIDGEYPLGFRLALHRKDLGIALEMAGGFGLDLPVAGLTAGLEDGLLATGHGDEDMSVLASAIRIGARISADGSVVDGHTAGGSRESANPAAGLYDPAMNYELFMGEALAEAQIALDQGKAPIGAVAVVNDAMVARAHDRVRETNDPTAHAVVVALREASRKMGRDRLANATIFVTREPCPMCVGALLASDVEALVYAVSNQIDGAAGGVLQLAQDGRLARKLKVVSGIRCEEAKELFAQAGPVESLRSSEKVEPTAG
jgi:tRNA(adenine34) deaminase